MVCFLFEKFFKRRRHNCKTAVNALGFKKKYLILNDWVASKVVLLIDHKSEFLR